MGCKCIQQKINNEDEIESKGKSKKKMTQIIKIKLK